MRERALGVQAGLTSVANEAVVLVMVGGAGSTAARGLRWPASSSSWLGTTSTDPRQPSLGWPDVLLTQNVHSTPITQQAEKLASHAQRANDVPVNFPWKLTKDKAVRYQSLERVGWYQTVPYLWPRSQARMTCSYVELSVKESQPSGPL
jgi:hypothetical protein